jgi:hypothetical protein
MYDITAENFKAAIPSIISAASGVSRGDNETAYTDAMFYAVYPQFQNLTPPVPAPVLAMFLMIAGHIVRQKEWGKMWEYAAGLVAAHFLTLYLRSFDPDATTADQAVAKSMVGGWQSSSSVDGVSVSYDYSLLNATMQQWGAWGLTTYGVQYTTFAKFIGKAGMYVW